MTPPIDSAASAVDAGSSVEFSRRGHGNGAPSTALAGPSDSFALLKPRVMSLVIFTAFVGMVCAYAAGATLDPVLAAVSLLAIAVGAGASGALNMWWDADIDRKMARTVGRPIPQGKVEADEAAAFGVALSALSCALLALASNYFAAGLLAFTIFFYAVVYSMWLKRSTPQNIVIGGAAGALPPVVAWAAAAGHTPMAPWVMFAVIFLWTPPHFWALALYREGDYDRAGVPMMPNVRGERSTRRQIFGYSVVLAAATILPFLFGVFGPVYAVAATALGLRFLQLGWAVLREADGRTKSAKALFRFSIFYLFAIFSALLADATLTLVLGATR